MVLLIQIDHIGPYPSPLRWCEAGLLDHPSRACIIGTRDIGGSKFTPSQLPVSRPVGGLVTHADVRQG